MTVKKYMHLRSTNQPDRPVLAYCYEGDILKALVSFRGTEQKHFYEVQKFAVGKHPLASFGLMNDALEFADEPP